MRVPGFLLAGLTGLLLASVACGLSAAQLEDSETAREGYRLAEPIIAALEKYKQDHGEYPGEIEVLVPDYLEKVPVSAQIDQFRYVLHADSYVLSFYLGTDSTNCFYRPGNDWYCAGAW